MPRRRGLADLEKMVSVLEIVATRPMNLAEIAEELAARHGLRYYTARPLVTRLVDELLRYGLVYEQAGRHGSRVIGLTQRGRRLLEILEPNSCRVACMICVRCREATIKASSRA